MAARNFTILDSHGAPSEWVSVSETVHDELLECACKLDLPLLSRVSDFYEEETFPNRELSALLIELERVTSHLSPQANETVADLRRIFDKALLFGQDIRVLPD